MSAKILDGQEIASEWREELKTRLAALADKKIQPGLAVILVGEEQASQLYVKKKQQACQEVGIEFALHSFPFEVDQAKIIEKINQLNQDPKVHGILVQLPLPKQLDQGLINRTIDLAKDMDCFHPANFGQMAMGGSGLLPCTPAGIIELLERSNIEIAGKDCVVVGRSNLVGKPLSLLLLQQDATVTICHSRTQDIVGVCQRADILVAAAGQPRLITADMVKQGAVVVDVGMNRDVDGRLVGDVDFGAVSQLAGFITPVPGGVGPMTIAALMRNIVLAAEATSN